MKAYYEVWADGSSAVPRLSSRIKANDEAKAQAARWPGKQVTVTRTDDEGETVEATYRLHVENFIGIDREKRTVGG